MMKVRTILLLFVCLGILLPGVHARLWAQTPGQVRIAVLPFMDSNTAAKEDGYGDAISGMLMTELINDPQFQVVERQEINRIMNELALQITGAVDSQTAKELGKLLGVDYLVLGNVSKFSRQIEVDMRMVDAESGEATLADHASCRDEAQIRNVIVELEQKISGRFKNGDLYMLSISTEPAGASVTIDGLPSGETPLNLNIVQGVHDVRINKSGYTSWQQQINVSEGNNNYNLQLVPVGGAIPVETTVEKDQSKKGGNKMLWILGGAALVGGGTYFLLNSGSGDDEKTNNSSVTINTNFP